MARYDDGGFGGHPAGPPQLPPVWLVGAGPGDPELLTRKAERLIGEAGVILHDALVSPEILALASPRAEIINVGKRCGQHSMRQSEINALLVAKARTGRRVVRLKGGDPAFFSRASEEIECLEKQGFDVQICPGITAASGAAASAGISLTERGTARGVRVLTGRLADGEANTLVQAAGEGETIILYMAKGSAADICTDFLMSGMAPDIPVLIVENATLANERVIRTTLEGVTFMDLSRLSGPAVTMIGEAVDARREVARISYSQMLKVA